MSLLFSAYSTVANVITTPNTNMQKSLNILSSDVKIRLTVEVNLEETPHSWKATVTMAMNVEWDVCGEKTFDTVTRLSK